MASRIWTPRHRATRRAPLRVMLTVTSAAAAATLIGLGAAGTTYALWQSEAPINSPTITSGTFDLQVNGTADYAVGDLAMTQLLPGRTIVSPTPLRLKNAGAAPMNVAISSIQIASSSASLADNLSVVLRKGTVCSALEDGGAGAGPELAAPVLFAVSQEISYCLEVTLSASAPPSVQGATADFTVNLSGVQVQP